MSSLIVKPSGLPEKLNKPWRLCVRHHDLGGVDYETVALLDDAMAAAVVDAGAPYWLFGTPDWTERTTARRLEEARALEEAAANIRLEVAKAAQPGAAT